MAYSSVILVTLLVFDSVDSSLDSSLDGLVLEDSSSSLVTSTSVASFLESGWWIFGFCILDGVDSVGILEPLSWLL